MEKIQTENMTDKLVNIFSRRFLPHKKTYQSLVEQVTDILLREPVSMRPQDDMGLSGGIIYLDYHKETLIVPDIHGRMDLLLSLALHKNRFGETVIEQMLYDQLQIVCVGDGMHAEGRAAHRWRKAYEEYKTGYNEHTNMDREMFESLGVMEMVMELKRAFPGSFHYLKGNHDNIANERGQGNYPFMKYAYEGPMVTEYLLKFYGLDFIQSYYRFEKNLPLLAVGHHFLISHAEPKTYLSSYEIQNYRKFPYAVEGLTWTGDGEADKENVALMLGDYIEPELQSRAYYFGGHRPVKHLYNARAKGQYIQIHNPDKMIVARINPYRYIDLDKDVMEIANQSALIN